MEHRWNSRKPVGVDVVLHYDGLGLIRGKTRNISYGGMYVETNAVNLAKNAVVSVHLPEPDDNENSLQTVRAMVVHTGQDGFGLMFLDFDRAMLRILRGLIGPDDVPGEASA